ncbi:MAG TPA: DUF1634 domain-containing protein [Rectinemataceae bacterium]|nr:DUF1634 domain-containing protein [Rectinemataceae bacterium]
MKNKGNPAPRPVGKEGNDAPDDPARTTELMVSFVLRSGVIISAAVIVIGLMLLVYHGMAGLTSGIATAFEFPHTFGAVFAGVAKLDPVSVISLGLLLMIITPVTRVAVSIVAFAMERDWRYVGITTLVLLVLLVSFALGKAGS